jgi:peptidoglycan/LPS O-acetylase OafA/YrhL
VVVAVRQRLDHVDAMRPIKQLSMITTHALLLFAPAAGVATGAALLISHVSRFTFMFISAAMLVYSYPQLARAGLPSFWRRRFRAVAWPYLIWTAGYFLVLSLPIPNVPSELQAGPGLVADPGSSALHFARLLATGYFQLYYLLLLIELYAAYPALLWVLRRTVGHHARLLGASFVLELIMTSLIHWALIPAWLRGGGANKELWNYQLYLIAGGLLAWHYEDAHQWLQRHSWRIVWATLALAVVAEVWYLDGQHVWPALAGASADSGPFQPIVVPLYLGLTATVYLAALALTDQRRSPRTRTLLRQAAANSYGIYLCHALVLIALAVISWGSLDAVLPWPVVVALGVVIVYCASAGLTSLLARLRGRPVTVGQAN